MSLAGFNLFQSLFGGCATNFNAIEGFVIGTLGALAATAQGTVITDVGQILNTNTSRLLLAMFGLSFIVLFVVLIIFGYGCILTWAAVFLILVTAVMVVYGLFIFARNEVKKNSQAAATTIVNDVVKFFVTHGPTALAVGGVGYALGLTTPVGLACTLLPLYNKGITGATGPTGATGAAILALGQQVQAMEERGENPYTNQHFQEQMQELIRNMTPHGYAVQADTAQTVEAGIRAQFADIRRQQDTHGNDGFRTIAAQMRDKGGGGRRNCGGRC